MYLCSQIQLNFINISQILIQDLMCVSCSVVKLCSLLHKIETKTSNLYKKKKRNVCGPQVGIILGWPKSLFGFFSKALLKNPKELFDQPTEDQM